MSLFGTAICYKSSEGIIRICLDPWSDGKALVFTSHKCAVKWLAKQMITERSFFGDQWATRQEVLEKHYSNIFLKDIELSVKENT